MTRIYAAYHLLEHGPLSYSEVKEITRWSASTVCWVLNHLVERGYAERVSGRPYKFRLAA